MANDNELIEQEHFIIFHQDILYAIYEVHWDKWFTFKDIRTLIKIHEDNKGFMIRAMDRNIFETENSHKPLKYKMTENTHDMVLNLKERQDQ